MIPFTKMHGLGNDFVILDAFRDRALDRREDLDSLAVAMCDRRRGAGADGLILLAPDGADADCDMTIRNADGSDGVICGNGLRCAVRLLLDRAHLPGPALRIRTGAGVRGARALESGHAEVEMGAPVTDLASLPVDPERIRPAGGGACEVNGRTGVFVGTGNPHFVVPVEGDLDAIDLAREGAALERHPAFPRRMNVQFVRVIAPDRLRVRTWERGAGATFACGTGACAALVGCATLGLAGREATVALPGGDLRVRWEGPGGRVHQAGPAAYVYEGRWVEGAEAP